MHGDPPHVQGENKSGKWADWRKNTFVLTAILSFGLFNIFLDNLYLMTVLTMIPVA
jgi:succinate-acetate transporter protein